MPLYRVIRAAGVQFPVGFEFETDSLSPVMAQHVTMAGGEKPKPEPKGSRVEDVDEAFVLATQEEIERKAKAAAADTDKTPKAKARKVTDGPGENS
jgi:hypothetical protein